MEHLKKERLTIHGQGDHITTDAGRIYYELEGSGPPVFLVPGGPGASHSHYHPWFSTLAKSHTVVYFDNLGTGASDRLVSQRDYTVQRYAFDIEALRSALGFEKIKLIGLSFGSLPALEYTTQHSSHVHSLVISNGHLNAATWQEGNIDNVNHEIRTLFPEVWSQMLELRSQGVLSGVSQYQALYEGLLADLNWVDPWHHPSLYQTDDPRDDPNYDVYLGFIGEDPEWTVTGTLQGYDPSPKLAKCNVPTLIVTGRYDRVTPPAIAYKIQEAFPPNHAQLIIFERSAHRPWVEETEKYFDVVTKFLG
ncbi:MAG TPA: hypothetical protein DCX53_14895 [Anaerolineae bacterium]|nr:hypothetical protein [Anaerolineae bacterium]